MDYPAARRPKAHSEGIAAGEVHTQETPALHPRLHARLTQQPQFQRSPWATPEFPRCHTQLCPETRQLSQTPTGVGSLASHGPSVRVSILLGKNSCCTPGSSNSSEQL